MTDSCASSTGLLQPGQDIKPDLAEAEVPALLLKLFGLQAATVRSLVSYDDLNFLIKVDPSAPITNPHVQSVNPDGYVMKLLNSMDSANPDLVAGQNAMMTHLSGKGYHCPVPQPTLHGQLQVLEHFSTKDSKDSGGKSHVVRLLTFVPSKLLANVPLTDALCYDAGRYLAEMQEDLKDFSHPTVSSRRFVWMMSQMPLVRQFVHAVTDPANLTLVKQGLDNWEAAVLPVMDQLAQGPVHGDFNEQNILVSATGPGSQSPSYKVSGVIDFGDVSESCYVFDLAIAVMSFMTLENSTLLAGHCIAGYCSRRPLTETEWSVIWECVCGRLCVSLTMGAYTYLQKPGNEYLLTTAKTGWVSLRSLLLAGKDSTLKTWRSVLQQYNQLKQYN